ncbi:hypothetical protein [Parabacteroides timonensis]|uniref:hypothetical protein n=1 Tax=Parabacteroides timonensis TaxID=1871013 RepID=UPI00094EF850|nr:hypothetical protein [Parabacteroides timonensis]
MTAKTTLIPINLPDFRRLEPLMTKYYGFDRYMLHHEIEALYQVHKYKLDDFAEGKDLSPYKRESSLMYESFGATAFDIERYTPKKKDEYISYQDVIFDSDSTLYISVSNDKLVDTILTLADGYGLTKEIDDDVVNILLWMAAIYEKYTRNSFVRPDDIENNYDSLAYAKSVRPEMLQLYEFLKTSKLTNLQIKSPNGSVTIPNSEAWFTTLLEDYLNIYLGVNDLEEAQNELKFTYGKKSGRKFDDPAFNIMAMGTFNILQHSSIASTKAGTITNQQCEFILEYLETIGCFKNDDRKNDMNYIRSAISIMKKQNFTSKWDYLLNFTLKRSPNNPTEGYYW